MRCPVKCTRTVRELASKLKYLLASFRNAMYHEVPCEVYNDNARDGQQGEIFTGLH